MAVTQKLPIGLRDAALPACNHVDNRVLAANTAETVTVPSGAASVFFGSDGDFGARWDGGTAAWPAADVTDGTGTEINPTWRALDGLTTFSIVAPATRVLSLSWFKTAGSASS